MSPSRRRLAAAAAMLLLAVLLTVAGCGSAEAGVSTLTVADQDFATSVPFTASNAGAGAGYGVEFAQFNGGQAVIGAVRSGAADVGFVGEAPPLLAISNAVDDIALIAASASPGKPSNYYLVAQPGSGIRTIHDLRGRAVAYPGGTGRHMVYASILRAAGLDMQQDVNSIEMESDQVSPAFAAGSIDAAIVEGATYFGLGAPPIIATGQGHTSSMSFLVVRRDTLDDDAMVSPIGDFVGRAVAAENWIAGHPEEYVQRAFVDEQNLTFAQGRQLLHDAGFSRYYPITPDVVDAYNQVAERLLSAGIIAEPINVHEYLREDFNDIVRQQNADDNVTPEPLR